MFVCKSRQDALGRALTPEHYWCFHTCHRCSDPHQHNDCRVNSLGVALMHRRKRWVEVWWGQAVALQYAAALILPCNTDWSVSTPSFLMGFCKLPIIHWHCRKYLSPSLSLGFLKLKIISPQMGKKAERDLGGGACFFIYIPVKNHGWNVGGRVLLALSRKWNYTVTISYSI